jgi:hypothetical protein
MPDIAAGHVVSQGLLGWYKEVSYAPTFVAMGYICIAPLQMRIQTENATTKSAVLHIRRAGHTAIFFDYY